MMANPDLRVRRRGSALRRWAAALLLLIPMAGCGSEPPAPLLSSRVDRGLHQGMRYLLACQQADGSWSTPVYGALRDDLAVTALLLKTLAFAVDVPGRRAACQRAAEVLAAAVRPDGTLTLGPRTLHYPVYTAALAVMGLARLHQERFDAAQEGWRRLLQGHQLTEALGWSPSDLAYGGWGYSLTPPQKPVGPQARRSYDADLSSTLFAVGALRQAGMAPESAPVARALHFVQRCQNLPAEGEPPDPAFDDGGFFFTPTNELQNKAGVAGVDDQGRRRFHSYGTMTADGLRALRACGLPPGHTRVQAALNWLSEHWSGARPPGVFVEVREEEREAASTYYAWSAAHAFRSVGADRVWCGSTAVPWAEDLGEALLAQQRTDGSWSNPFTEVMEDDPLVATPLALAALSLCRSLLLP